MASMDPLERDIVSDLQKAFDQAPASAKSTFGQKSVIWSRPALQFRNKMFGRPLVEGIRELQRDGELVFTFSKDSVRGGQILQQQLDFLQSIDLDLRDMPQDICESPLTDPQFVFTVQDRPLSTELLCRLIMTQRVWEPLSRPQGSVLEIGAGVGGFARVAKLRNPTLRYVIIDLLDTMVLSYVFLRLNFPDARFTLVHNPSELADLDLSADFVFIPAHLVSDLERTRFDLVVNSFSLGEMPQPVVDSYMGLIQETLDVDRFYSLNRYLQHEKFAGWLDESKQASYSTPLDSNWNVLRWEFCPPFVQRHLVTGGSKFIRPEYEGAGGELDSTATLELYVERAPGRQNDPDGLRIKSDELLSKALELGELRGPEWHRLMWESILLSPRRENVGPYYSCLKMDDVREYRYFGRLLASLGGEVVAPYTMPRVTPLRSLRSVTGSLVRRVAKPMMRLLDS